MLHKIVSFLRAFVAFFRRTSSAAYTYFGGTISTTPNKPTKTRVGYTRWKPGKQTRMYYRSRRWGLPTGKPRRNYPVKIRTFQTVTNG